MKNVGKFYKFQKPKPIRIVSDLSERVREKNHKLAKNKVISYSKMPNIVQPQGLASMLLKLKLKQHYTHKTTIIGGKL